MALYIGLLGVNGTADDDVMRPGFIFNPDWFGPGDHHVILEQWLSGGAGNDTLYGYKFPLALPGGISLTADMIPAAYATVLAGGDGNDTLYGGNAADALIDGDSANESGTDFFYGNDGNDYFILDYGNNWASGGAGKDSFTFRGYGTNTILGGSGGDVFTQDGVGVFPQDGVVSGTTHIDGGDGVDTLVALNLANLTWTNVEVLDTGTVGYGNRLEGTIAQFMSFSTIKDAREVFEPILQLTGAGGVLDLSASAAEGVTAYGQWLSSGSTFIGGAAGDALVGSYFDDVIRGGAGNDRLYGEDGDDTLDGGTGGDWLIGNVGVDTVTYASSALRVTVDLSSGTGSQGAAGDRFDSIENVTGSAFDDTLIGNFDDNLLDGGEGADSLTGGGGDDTYYVNQSGDRVFEGFGGGFDTIFTTANYQLRAGQEVEVISVASGPAHALLAIGLTGNEFDNTLIGNDAANRLDGGNGNDTLIGGAGIDQLFGRSGNDTYYVDHAGDKVTEAAGGGTDTVYASATYTLRSGQEIENLAVDPEGAFDNVAIDLNGNEFSNTLTGNAAANKLNGMGGADTMVGGGGNDTYLVSDDGDLVIEGASAGDDTVRATVSYSLTENVENLVLLGKTGINGTGNDLRNELSGNTAQNTLDGGLGNDVLNGGGGGDTFRFSTSLGPDNVDRIVSFDHAGDMFQLHSAIFDSLALGGLSADAFALGREATDANDRILYHEASKTLFYDADGNGALEAVKFATIGKLTGTLDHTDFFVI